MSPQGAEIPREGEAINKEAYPTMFMNVRIHSHRSNYKVERGMKPNDLNWVGYLSIERKKITLL